MLCAEVQATWYTPDIALAGPSPLADAFAAWLDSADLDRSALRSTLSPWLRTMAKFAKHKDAHVSELLPVCNGLVSLLSRCQFSASSGTSIPAEVLGSAAELLAACPQGIASIVSAQGQPRAKIIRNLAQCLSASLEAALATLCPKHHVSGSEAVSRQRSTAWQAASRYMQAMSALACHEVMHRDLVLAGVDDVLVTALQRAPALRDPADDSCLVSHSAARVLALLQQRMRWPRSAQVLSQLQHGTSLDSQSSALLSLLKTLLQGHAGHDRCGNPSRARPSRATYIADSRLLSTQLDADRIQWRCGLEH
jgi:hypothetical protein